MRDRQETNRHTDKVYLPRRADMRTYYLLLSEVLATRLEYSVYLEEHWVARQQILPAQKILLPRSL